MASIINATTTNGVAISADNSGILQLATNSGTTALTLSAAQAATFVSTLNATVITGTTLTAPILNSATTLSLQTNGSITAVTIDASQNVGIGTASPTQKLDITNGRIALTEVYDIRWLGTGNTIRSSISADSGSNLYFGTGSSNTERMRIDSSGNLLVGTTSSLGTLASSTNAYGFIYNPNDAITTATNNSSANIIVNRTNSNTAGSVLSVRYNGSVVGSITTNGSTTAYNTSSDYRLKEDVAPMVGALDTIAKLKPVTYKWKVDGSNGQGFIAHELQAVVPDCITGEKDAVNEDGTIKPQGIDTSFLVGTLTCAIQEQQALITTLQTQITALNAKVGI